MKWLLGCISFCACIFLACSGNADLTGTKTGSETTNGIIANKDGKPVAGALVSLYTNNFSTTGKSLSPKATCISDANGNYSFDSTFSNEYVVNATYGTSLGVRSNVINKTKDIENITLNTLRLDSLVSFAGRIVLYNNDDPRTIDVFVSGSSLFAQPTEDGYFNFGFIPKGTYSLRIRSTLDLYGVLDTLVSFHSDSFLANIKLPYRGVPSPDTLKLSCDLLKQSVSLVWPVGDTALIKGYNVYRAALGENDSLLSKTYIPVSTPNYTDTSVLERLTYTYHVVSIGKITGGESIKRDFMGNTVVITGIDSLVHSLRVTGDSTTICDMALLDSNTYGIAQKSISPRIYRYAQNGALISSFWPSDSLKALSNNSISNGDSGTLYFCASVDSLHFRIVNSTYAGAIKATYFIQKQPYSTINANAITIEPYVRYQSGKILLVWFEELFTWFDPKTKTAKSLPKPYQTSMRCASTPDANTMFFVGSSSNTVVTVDTLGRQTSSWTALPSGVVAVNTSGSVILGSRNSNEVRLYWTNGAYRGRFRLAAPMANMRALEVDKKGLVHVLGYEQGTRQALVHCYYLKGL